MHGICYDREGKIAEVMDKTSPRLWASSRKHSHKAEWMTI